MANPLPEWVPLNWDLISNPANWAVVILMVIIGSIILLMLAGAIGNTSSN